MGDDHPRPPSEVDRVATLLIAEWERVEGKPVNVSFVATFCDLARVAIADRQKERKSLSDEMLRLDRLSRCATIGCGLGGRCDHVGLPQYPARVAAERDAYRAMVCDLLASASPHPTEHPTMARQWERARALLKDGPSAGVEEASRG